MGNKIMFMMSEPLLRTKLFSYSCNEVIRRKVLDSHFPVNESRNTFSHEHFLTHRALNNIEYCLQLSFIKYTQAFLISYIINIFDFLNNVFQTQLQQQFK